MLWSSGGGKLLPTNVTGMTPSIQGPERTQETKGDKISVKRDGGGSAGSGFSPRTNVSIKNSIDNMAGVLSKISSHHAEAENAIPNELKNIIQNIMRNAFNLEGTVGEGVGSSLASQRFSVEQLNTLSRILTQLGNMADHGNLGEFTEELQTVFDNLKSVLGNNSSMEPVNINKLAFQLLQLSEGEEMPKQVEQLLAQLTAMTNPQPVQGGQQPAEGLNILNKLVDAFFPKSAFAGDTAMTPSQQGNTQETMPGLPNGAQGAQSGAVANQGAVPQGAQSGAVANQGAVPQGAQSGTMANQGTMPQGTQSGPTANSGLAQTALAGETAGTPSGNPSASAAANIPGQSSQAGQPISNATTLSPSNGGAGQPGSASMTQTASSAPSGQPGAMSQEAQPAPSGQLAAMASGAQSASGPAGIAGQSAQSGQPIQAGQSLANSGTMSAAAPNQAGQSGQPVQGNTAVPAQQPTGTNAPGNPAASAQQTGDYSGANPNLPGREPINMRLNSIGMAYEGTSARMNGSMEQNPLFRSIFNRFGSHQPIENNNASAGNTGNQYQLPAMDSQQVALALKDAGQLIMKNMELSPKEAQLLNNFINKNQGILSEQDAKQLNSLLRTIEGNIPASVQQAAQKMGFDSLPKLWAFMQLADIGTLKKMKGYQYRNASKEITNFTNAVKGSMDSDGAFKADGQKSISYMMPIYVGDGTLSYPAYLHIYDEPPHEDEYGVTRKDTWFRVCVLTDEIGAVDVVCRLYDGNNLNLRVVFSDNEAVDEFKEYLPAIRKALYDTPINLTDLRIGTVNHDE